MTTAPGSVPSAAIEVKDLTRRFGSFVAVDHLNFSIPRGRIFGFLGPNGSGKSTCMRMLCGLLEPSEGTALVNGYDIRTHPEQVKVSIGYMNQIFSLYRDLSVRENLEFFGGVYGLRGARLTTRRDEVVQLTGLKPYLNRRSGQLSGGWKQRLALATALIHEPPLLFLDEPTAGIDPVARRDLWDLLFTLAHAGITLFVTTHYMDEAERCDQIGYIWQSRLMVHGTPAELKALPEVSPPGTRRIAVAVTQPSPALAVLRPQPFTRDATLAESEIHLLVDQDTSDAAVVRALDDAQLPGATVRPIGASLEDVFVTLTRNLSQAES